MMDEKMLDEYKKLTPYAKNNLYYFLAFRSCYDYDLEISDDLVKRISVLAYECWIKDNNYVDIDNYVNYILNAIYQYDGTMEQIEENSPEDIIELYTNEKSPKELLIYNPKNLDYAFTTTNGEKYYISDDGFVILDKDGHKIKEPHMMDYEVAIFFQMLKDKEITHISMKMHHTIRCIMRSQFGDEEYDFYKEGIEHYRKYCEENHITSMVILDSVGGEEDIDLFEIDIEYTIVNKLERLQKLFKKANLNNAENYEYIASLNNGMDYYFDKKRKNNYISIDKNGSLKKDDNQPFFILNKISDKKNDFIYISKSEQERIKHNLEEYFEVNVLRIKEASQVGNYSMLSLEKFFDYINSKESNVLKKDEIIVSYIETIVNQYKDINEMMNINKKKMKSSNIIRECEL